MIREWYSSLYRYLNETEMPVNEYNNHVYYAVRALRNENNPLMLKLGMAKPSENGSSGTIDYMRPPENYAHMSALRHLGFPSPFIDFTSSIAIALFFACSENYDKDGKIFIYSHLPCGTGCFGGSIYQPQINSLGRFIESHHRHDLQQGSYLIPTRYNDNNQEVYTAFPDSDIFNKTARASSRFQSILITVKIPCGLKKETLKYLDIFNINHYSLFHDTENHVKTLAFRQFGAG